MNDAAQFVMQQLHDVILAFGESDEYRWVNMPVILAPKLTITLEKLPFAPSITYL